MNKEQQELNRLRATVAKLTEERDALKQAYLNVADERSQLRAQLAEWDGRIAVLHEALSKYSHECADNGPCTGCGAIPAENDNCGPHCPVKIILTNTAQAAAAHDERVRAEERERCVSVVQQTCKHAHDGAICACADAIAALSTAGKEET